MSSAGMRLALEGGEPVRRTRLPYARQWIEDDDVRAVVETLRSEWLTTGPKVQEFERAFAASVGAAEAVAVSSGTAALHAALHALDVGPGDEVIVPAMTFAATANAAVYLGATPIFADVDPGTLLLTAETLERRITLRTKAAIAVDYAGQPCDYDALEDVARRHHIALVSDACHSLGASFAGRPVGTLANLNAFSLHPAKAITTAEGGMITTADEELAQRMRLFRQHGISTARRGRDGCGGWYYEQLELGFNYRLSDVQCALGISQLTKLPGWLGRRRTIAARYDAAIANIPGLRPLARQPRSNHAYHLYVVRFDMNELATSRTRIFDALQAEGIGVQVHYIPVHLHPYYRRRFGAAAGLCPYAEQAYEEIISLPIFPRMSDGEVADVIAALEKVVLHYRRL